MGDTMVWYVVLESIIHCVHLPMRNSYNITLKYLWRKQVLCIQWYRC